MFKGFIILLSILAALPAYAALGNTSGPWGMHASGFDNLSTALASPTTAGKTVVISTPMAINNKTITRAISVTAGGRINVAGGKTVVFAAPLDAGRYQIFAGSGTVTGLKEAQAEWFASTQAGLQAALNAAARVYISSSYTITGNGLDLNDEQEVIGLGWPVLTSSDSYIMSVNRDTGGTADPADNKRNIRISGISFVHTGAFWEHTHQLNINAISDAIIENNRFSGFMGDGIYLGSSNVAGIERHNERVVIRNNYFDGVNKENRNGISIIDGTDITVENNYFTRCSKSTMPGAIDIEPNADAFARIRNIVIQNNQFDDIGGGAVIGVVLPLAQSALTTPVRGIKILNNDIRNCSDTSRGLFVMQAADATATTTPQHVTLSGNTVYDVTIFLHLEGLSGAVVENNYFDKSKQTGYLGFDYDNYDLTLDKNVFRKGGQVDGVALTVYSIDYLQFSNNLFDDNGEAGGAGGTALNFNTGTSNHVTFRDNNFISTTGKTVVAIGKEAGHTFTPGNNVWEDNVFTGLGNAFLDEDGVYGDAFNVLSGNATTYNVTYGTNFGLSTTVPTTVNEFTGGHDGKEIRIIVTDNTTTFDESGNLRLSAPFTSAGQTAFIFIYSSGTGKWHEFSRNPN